VPFPHVLCPDPTLVARNPIALPVPRFILPLRPVPVSEPGLFTVGSFGFATGGKGFDRLCGLVCDQFDEALIRINLPFHDSEQMVSHSQVDAVIAACRARLTKRCVTLEVTHHFLDDEALLTFLASNTINAFLYDEVPGRGVSSCTDYALACQRPFAISRSSMFRHLHGISPSICVDDRPLRAIADSGIGPLRHHLDAYSPRAAGQAWNSAIRDALAVRAIARLVPDGRGFNKLLDDRSRSAYAGTIADLNRHAPEMMARKIPEANVQQGFALDAAERLVARYPEPRILAVGSFEDTAVATLRAKGFRIDEVDPNVNGISLEAFYCSNAAVPRSYEIILCVSVLEHVADDDTFVRILGDLLAPEGVAILTVDFSNRYAEHGLKPGVDCRLYTTHDLRDRLMQALPECALLDPPNWDDGDDEFEFDNCRYSFASWVFRKLPTGQLRHSVSSAIVAGVPWKTLIRAQQALAIQQAKRVSDLEAGLAGLRAERNRLCLSLRMESGPRALCMVLPLARMIRRIAGTRVP
jgi:hypothetical protein